MTDIWESCAADIRPQALMGALSRVVESQEQVATNSLVDSLEEQALLEELLERTKPGRRPGTAGLHFLLATPFRYPPLRHGSRFASRFEPSLFYGGRERRTALIETAYYRFVFWTGMRLPPPSGRLVTQHTVFEAGFRTRTGLQLQTAPFNAHEALLRAKLDYAATQLLGRRMREAGIEAFEYRSARDPEGGINAALFVPAALTRRAPLRRQQWLCDTRAGAVAFTSKEVSAVLRVPVEIFLVDGRLPLPPA